MRLNLFCPKTNQIKNNGTKITFFSGTHKKEINKKITEDNSEKKTLNNKNNDNRRKFIKNAFSLSNILIQSSIFGKINDVNAKNNNIDGNNKGFFTKSGLKIIDFVEGSDQKPEWGDFIIINYVIYRNISGNLVKIADTYDQRNPYSYVHGNGQIIKGIEEAVHGMRKGGKRRIVVPDELSYNVSGMGPIPPEIWKRRKIFIKDDTQKKSNFLVFDIELIDVKKNDFNQKWFTNKISGEKAETLLQPK